MATEVKKRCLEENIQAGVRSYYEIIDDNLKSLSSDIEKYYEQTSSHLHTIENYEKLQDKKLIDLEAMIFNESEYNKIYKNQLLETLIDMTNHIASQYQCLNSMNHLLMLLGVLQVLTTILINVIWVAVKNIYGTMDGTLMILIIIFSIVVLLFPVSIILIQRRMMKNMKNEEKDCKINATSESDDTNGKSNN